MKFSLMPEPERRDANALIGLHAAALALHHLHIHLKRVARLEIGDLARGRELGDLVALKRLDDVHGEDPLPMGRALRGTRLFGVLL